MTEPIDGTRIVFSMEARPIRAISRLFLAMGTLFVVSGTQMGWVALSQASAPGSETTFLLGFAAIALAAGLAQPAGNDNGDLEEEGHNVTWQQVRNIEPPIADEDSFAVDVGWRQPLRLPTSARSEDGRTFSPALLEAWQAWRDSAELRDGPGPA